MGEIINSEKSLVIFWVLIYLLKRKYFSKCLRYVTDKKMVETLNQEIVEIKTRKSSI